MNFKFSSEEERINALKSFQKLDNNKILLDYKYKESLKDMDTKDILREIAYQLYKINCIK